jgi:hypothetical protein
MEMQRKDWERIRLTEFHRMVSLVYSVISRVAAEV